VVKAWYAAVPPPPVPQGTQVGVPAAVKPFRHWPSGQETAVQLLQFVAEVAVEAMLAVSAESLCEALSADTLWRQFSTGGARQHFSRRWLRPESPRYDP